MTICKLTRNDWNTKEKETFSIFGIQARNICPNGSRCKTPESCNKKQHIHPIWMEDLLIQKDGKMKKLCTYHLADGYQCTRSNCWFPHVNLEWIWQNHKDQISQENSVDCLTGLPISTIMNLCKLNNSAPIKNLVKTDKWLSVDCGSDSDCDSTESSKEEESPPPAGKRDVKDILKENGYQIVNNDAYSREMKPHCHVIFDSDNNSIKKAFFTFDA